MNEIDAAQVGKMYVVSVGFTWHEASTKYDNSTAKTTPVPGHWNISVTLADKPSQYATRQTTNIQVEQGIGQKLAEVLLPVIIADASQKAEQLANDSKAMLAALGERTIACITDMPNK